MYIHMTFFKFNMNNDLYTLKYTEINETTIFEDHLFPEQLQLSSLFFNVHGLL